jgi:guanosine-3',5'-bis(diphosphate) 3'-pyrophosphohydrolase
VLTAAVLHDTVEDTTTDFDDVAEHFGAEVASWVAALSKDKRLGEEEREEKYKQTLAAAPWQVQVCKLADIFDNLLDSSNTSAASRQKTLRRSHDYLKALRPNLKAEAQPHWQTVADLLGRLGGVVP